MSEAMSSVEIEDVLSSIRRLVSEDLRPANRASVKKADDKLILTPALRVVAESDETILPLGTHSQTTAAPPVDAPRPNVLPRLHLGAEPVIEKLVATLERAVEAQDIEWESEVGDPPPIVAEMEWSDSGWVSLDAVVQSGTLEEAPAVDPAQTAAMPSWAQVDPEQADEADSFASEEVQDVAAIAEPDDYWADQAEAEALAELKAAKAGDAGAQAASAHEVTFDEEVLRDLVRDLIREELQGGLGERITRNVRKLVRAEIARALAAQEIE